MWFGYFCISSTYQAWLSPQTVTLYQTHLSMWRLSTAVDKEEDGVYTPIDCLWKPANKHVWCQLNHLVFRERELGLNSTQLIVISEKRIMRIMSIRNMSEPGKTTLSIEQSQGRDNGGKSERSCVMWRSSVISVTVESLTVSQEKPWLTRQTYTLFSCLCVRASHVNYLFLAQFNSCSGILFTSSLVIVENNIHIYIKQFGE